MTPWLKRFLVAVPIYSVTIACALDEEKMAGLWASVLGVLVGYALSWQRRTDEDVAEMLDALEDEGR